MFPTPYTDTSRGSAAFSVNLQPRAMFSVPDAADVRITCAEGAVWITLDHDVRDILLDLGEVFVGREHSRAIIYALKPSTIRVAAPARAQSKGRDAAPALVLEMQPA